jgi:hypothetical protein
MIIKDKKQDKKIGFISIFYALFCLGIFVGSANGVIYLIGTFI